MTGWDLANWDSDRWRPRVAAARCRAWIGATRGRRWTAWLLAAMFVLFVFPGIVGAVATAGTGNLAAGSSTNNALSALQVHDSDGVNLADYAFVVHVGISLFNPVNAGLAIVIGVIFAGWIVIVGGAIWLIGWVFSFVWLDLIGSVMAAVARSFTSQVATSIMLVTAATIGGVIVAVFIVRQQPAKATAQVVTMIGVAMIGPIFLADPLADIVSSHGVLVTGRDVGLSVAAGLHGNSAINPDQLVSTMQTDMVDNFARKPLQVWNFGQVIDQYPGCRSVWSKGIAGNGDDLRDQLKGCGDGGVAYAMTSEPSVGQIGAGLLILLSSLIMLYFAAKMAVRIIWAGLDAIYHGFMMIFGLAAGGFIYGPTQTFMARNAADAVIAGGRMAANTIFLSVYLLVIGRVFDQAGGQVVSVLFVGAVIQVVGVAQLRRLNDSLSRGNEWIADRFAGVMRGDRAGSSGGGGGGGAGMGAAGVTNSMGAGATLLAGMGVLSTLNNSPASAWLLGAVNPLNPRARLAERQRRVTGYGYAQPHMMEAFPASYMNRLQYAEGARDAVEEHEISRIRGFNATETLATPADINIPSGIDTARGAALAVRRAANRGAMEGDLLGALTMAGFTDRRIMLDAIDAHNYGQSKTAEEPAKFKPLAAVEALHRAFESNPTEANLYALEMAAVDLRTQRIGGVSLTNAQLDDARQYLANPSLAKVKELQLKADRVDADGSVVSTQTKAESDGAARTLNWIANGHAMNILGGVDTLLRTPLDEIQAAHRITTVGGANSREVHPHVRSLRGYITDARAFERHTQGEGASGADLAPPRPTP
ncbi:hypothetical protein [Nocardia cyriacigeorgica]|uniref:hypothetical protein n=1 Tax=Nocardia cyriacigeorgica TaxID=135487 RepID=UPI001895F05A|nr:hypothetical protein [Nocardia cyriacigeorgica]MBF6089218.1 hypothetical protein [Nocardia cyriacigeorgica]MBF6093921.1 hypothetical protein [Nocardia cyriacigeorgica]